MYSQGTSCCCVPSPCTDHKFVVSWQGVVTEIAGGSGVPCRLDGLGTLGRGQVTGRIPEFYRRDTTAAVLTGLLE